jgi:tetratricopeptide (TPR) repeat protein
LEIDQSYSSAWIYRGIAFYYLCQYEDALASFDEAIDIDPSGAAPWFFMGEALRKLYRETEADSAYARAKELGWKLRDNQYI